MRGMILAAGRGERMGELTRTIPKPLLQVGNRYLIEYAIERLREAGITEIVINVSYLGQKIKSTIGNGSQYGVSIRYSEESERLETGGGILKALPLLGSDPFVVVSGDVVCDFQLSSLPKQPTGLAHLVLVPNPDFHLDGDFGLQKGYVEMNAKPRFTFGNIGVYRKELFESVQPGFFPLSKLLFPAIENHQVTGELYKGSWCNVGTPDQLSAVLLSATV